MLTTSKLRHQHGKFSLMRKLSWVIFLKLRRRRKRRRITEKQRRQRDLQHAKLRSLLKLTRIRRTQMIHLLPSLVRENLIDLKATQS